MFATYGMILSCEIASSYLPVEILRFNSGNLIVTIHRKFIQKI